jgi:hypothetical protein
MDHPNIAKVLDAGTVGVHALACPPSGPSSGGEGEDTLKRELQPGPAILRHGTGEGHPAHPILRRAQAAGARPPEPLHASLLGGAARAPEGIIHRDLKPTNPGAPGVESHDPGAPGVPKAIDFGLTDVHGDVVKRLLG